MTARKIFSPLHGILIFLLSVAVSSINLGCSSPRKTIPLTKCKSDSEKYDDTTKKCVAKDIKGGGGGGGGGGDDLIRDTCKIPKILITIQSSSTYCAADASDAEAKCKAELNTSYDPTSTSCVQPTEKTCDTSKGEYKNPAAASPRCVARAEAERYCEEIGFPGGYSVNSQECVKERDTRERTQECTTTGLVPNPLDSSEPCITSSEAHRLCQDKMRNGRYGEYMTSTGQCYWGEDRTDDDRETLTERRREETTTDDTKPDVTKCIAEHRLYSGSDQICCPRILRVKRLPTEKVIPVSGTASTSSCQSHTLEVGQKICSTGSLAITPGSPAASPLFNLSFWELPGTQATSSCVYETRVLGAEHLEEISE